MARKKADQIGQGIGLIIGLALVAAVIAAALLPLYLLGALVKNAWISRKLRKDLPAGGQVAWLTEAERQRFKQIHPDCIALREFVDVATERSERPGLLRTKDGSLDLRNSENKKLTQDLSKARQMLDRLERELGELEYKAFMQWHELNDVLKKCSRMWMALFGWMIGATFLYSKTKAGAPINIWIDFFVLALCAGAGVLFAMAFSRYPASVYSPMPATVDMDNVDSPVTRRPLQKRSKLIQFLGAFVWSSLMITAVQKGKEYGAAEAISHRERIAQQEALSAQNERMAEETWDLGHSLPESASRSGLDASALEKIRNTAYEMPIAPFTISKLNAGEVEDIILNIYARHGAVFESAEAQNWAAQQPWYRAVPGKTIKDADEEFGYIVKTNVTRLVERWNRIQIEEGHAALPVDESPLAGRGVSPDIEMDVVSGSPIVLKALPVDQEPPSAMSGNLKPEEIESWDEARVRAEINTIYARHGVVFPKKELQDWAEKQPWYQPVPGLTFEQAEERFSVEERHDIEALAARRDLLLGGNQPERALPGSAPLRPELVATWDATRVRNEINTIYASYGVDFTSAELRKWAEKQPGYKCVPGLTFADAEALFSDTDRGNIEVLAARRAQINSRAR
ncbi:MAG: YARHG domain-containing protein [Akkermansiaceae bacterium]|nr:YARHG domain-containing protein [Akkermansiaceae bacterium]MCF7730308.1 YARHG domain-containing protein [Akkermansiaceae bacterium]